MVEYFSSDINIPSGIKSKKAAMNGVTQEKFYGHSFNTIFLFSPLTLRGSDPGLLIKTDPCV